MNLYRSLKERGGRGERKKRGERGKDKEDYKFEVGLKMFITNLLRPLMEVYADFREF